MQKDLTKTKILLKVSGAQFILNHPVHDLISYRPIYVFWSVGRLRYIWP